MGSDNGIELVDVGTMINAGTITGGLDGLNANRLGRLVNSGVIQSTSANSGVEMGFGVIENSGTIRGLRGIEADRGSAGNVVITNSGMISSNIGPSGVALDLRGVGADSLTLNAGSRLVGTVNWNGTDDTLNFGPGLNAIVYFGLDDPETTNFSSPLNASGAGFRAQSDIGTLAVMDDALGDVIGGINSIVLARTDLAFLPLEQGSSSGASDRVVWSNVWGGTSDQDATSSSGAVSHRFGGIVAGADWKNETGGLNGFYGGIASGTIDATAQETQTDSYYGGVYALRRLGGATLAFNLTAGQTNFSSSRSIADSSAATGVSTAKADYKGLFISPSAKYASAFNLGEQQIVVSATAGYEAMFLEGYAETGSNANITIDDREIHQLMVRGQIDWIKDVILPSGSTLTWIPFVGAEQRVALGGSATTATFLGQTSVFDPDEDGSAGSVFAGAKLQAYVNDTTSMFGSLEGSKSTGGTTSALGQIGFVMQF